MKFFEAMHVLRHQPESISNHLDSLRLAAKNSRSFLAECVHHATPIEAMRALLYALLPRDRSLGCIVPSFIVNILDIKSCPQCNSKNGVSTPWPFVDVIPQEGTTTTLSNLLLEGQSRLRGLKYSLEESCFACDHKVSMTYEEQVHDDGDELSDGLPPIMFVFVKRGHNTCVSIENPRKIIVGKTSR